MQSNKPHKREYTQIPQRVRNPDFESTCLLEQSQDNWMPAFGPRLVSFVAIWGYSRFEHFVAMFSIEKVTSVEYGRIKLYR